MWTRGTAHARSSVAAIAFVALAVPAGARPATALARASPVEPDARSRIIGVTKKSAGAVTVTLTPRRHAEGRLFVEVAVDTHSVNDLDKYDLKEIVSLEVDGKRIAPTSAPGLRGHHSRGELVFRLETLPRKLAIEIRGLDRPALRVFSWP